MDLAGEIELSIVLPCLDEAETLASCVRTTQAYLARGGVDGEVVVADNGSSDGSQEIARGLGARVVEVPQRGYGNALVAGGIERGAMPPLHRWVGNPVLSAVGRRFFRSSVHDFHCGLRGFDRRRVLGLELASSGMEFASELVVKACLAGLRISEVATPLRRDGRSRPSHLRSWRDGWRHLRFLLIFSPRWLFLYPGLTAFFVGGLLISVLLVGSARSASTSAR